MGKIILVCILIILIILYFIVGNYFYNLALNPRTDKEIVLKELSESEEYKKRKQELLEWLTNNSKDTYITSSKNGELKLHAYELINDNSNIWTIVIHGYMGQGNGMTGFANAFYNRGYNVLVVDLRGHGKSEGNYVGMGWHDRLDIVDWINYIIEKNNDSKVILFGISMGAATTMMTTGETLPKNVKLAIEDCGYTSTWDEFSYKLKQLFKLPTFPTLNAANTVCRIRAGYDFKESSAVEQVKKSKTPTLFIHGSEDTFVPFEMLDKVYNAANCEKEKLVIEGAEHGMASTINPELYWQTIDRFIEKYI